MKKHYIKKLFATVAVLLCSITANAYDFEVDGIYYNIISATDLTVEVTEGENEYTGKVIIPSNVVYKSKVLTITSIGENAFKFCDGLTSVEIPNSVTSIGSYAFYGCIGLTSVTIPNSVTSIGDGAFFYCTRLTSVTIPNSVTSIGSSAFYGCSNLKKLEINCAKIEAWFSGDNYSSLPIEELIIGDNTTEIGERAFCNMASLAKVTIGKNVKVIRNEVFSGCNAIETIYAMGERPALVGENNFTMDQYLNVKLYVPAASLHKYEISDIWENFWEIQEFDVTAIENVEDVTPAFEITSNGIQFTAADGKAISIYAANGALVEKISNYAGEEITLNKGVYIVRVGDKTMKVKL